MATSTTPDGYVREPLPMTAWEFYRHAEFVATTSVFDFSDRMKRVEYMAMEFAYADPNFTYLTPEGLDVVQHFAVRAEFLTPEQVRVFANAFFAREDLPPQDEWMSPLNALTSLSDAADLVGMTADTLVKAAEPVPLKNQWLKAHTDYAKRTGNWHLIVPAMYCGIDGSDIDAALEEIAEVHEEFTVDGRPIHGLIDAHLGASRLGMIAKHLTVEDAVRQYAPHHVQMYVRQNGTAL